MTTPAILQQHLEIIRRANEIAASSELDTLLEEMLDLLMTIVEARAAACYLYDGTHRTLNLVLTKGSMLRHRSTDQQVLEEQSLMHQILEEGQPVFFTDVLTNPHLCELVDPASDLASRTLYCFPFTVQGRSVGLVQLFGLPRMLSHTDDGSVMLLHLVLGRLSTEIEKTSLLNQQQQLLKLAEYQAKRSEYRESQLDGLIDFISAITTTLEREELIRLIMSYAEELLGVETTSFWLLDEEQGRLKLLVAGEATRDKVSEVSVALGEGIIGYVVQTGELKVVNDVRQEPLFNTTIDLKSGFVTRSILSVPMKAPKIQRGDLRGEIQETIIGGAQALNKRDGTAFTEDDIRCFETLARQAAIAFQFSNLFEEDYTLFWGIVKATTGAIDLIDPYTRGHSERVSDFSVAIAEQLGLPPPEIYRIRVGSVLHDVGKLGVDPRVLKKPGRLTEEEFQEMQKHPTYGCELFQEAGLGEILREELTALAQHHERLDGKGYPNGLRGDQISRIGRIVAVADIFDALTSDRPYRHALSVEEAFDILEKISGSELDADCVAALIQSRARGKILTQHEREGHAVSPIGSRHDSHNGHDCSAGGS